MKRRTFDAFARQRILDKLDYIQRLHPRLSQEEIAAQIQELTKTTFDRKYLSRLRKGTLSDAGVGNVAAWIDARHDPHFLETLQLDEQHFSQASVSKHAVVSRKEWIAISPDESAALASPAETALGLPEGYCRQARMDFRAISFLRAARVLRVSLLREGAIFAFPFYLLERGGELRSIHLGDNLLAFEPDIDSHTLLDIAAFYLECVDASAQLAVFASPIDATYYLHEKRGLPFALAAKHIESDIRPIFEPPMVQQRPEAKSFLLRVDAASGERYERLLIEVSEQLRVSILSRRPIADLPSRQEITALPAPRPISGTTATRDIEPLAEILRESDTGASLLKTFALRPAPIISVPAAREER